jgi:5'-nucleotidase
MYPVRKLVLTAGLLACCAVASANDTGRGNDSPDDEQSYETEHSYDRGKHPGHPGFPREITIKIVALNDFHGQLQSPGSFSSIPAGGVDALAAHVVKFKAVNPRTVVVSAGDLIGATPLVSALFHDEGTIETMNRVGLDYNAVGNHEFDEGRTELLRMQRGGCNTTDTNTCKGADVGTPVPFEGADFRFLAANVVDSKTGRTLLAPYGIKRFGRVKVAFIGMTLKETPTIVTPSGVAGLTFKDEIETVNALVPKLRRRGVEAIVVLLHQGGFQGSTAPNFINDCSQSLQNDTSSPIRRIVRGFDDAVDLVVSGHTHTGYNCMLPNKAGRMIRVTQASSIGRVLTDIDLRIDTRTGDVLDTTANNVIVDRTAVTPDAVVAGIVQGYSALVSPLSNAVVGTTAAALPNTANAAGEMLAGKLIADAQLAATSAPTTGGAEVAFQNAGGVRNPGFVGTSYPDDITYGEAFTVQPFGNSMVTMTLTNQQIRDLLEQQFVGCNGQTVQRIMQVSASFSYSWSASGTCGTRIVNVTLNGTPIVSAGVVQSPTTTHRVTVNNFMATGGDGYTVLRDGTNQLGGPQDVDALLAYLAAYKAPNAPYDPAAFPARITQLP